MALEWKVISFWLLYCLLSCSRQDRCWFKAFGDLSITLNSHYSSKHRKMESSHAGWLVDWIAKEKNLFDWLTVEVLHVTEVMCWKMLTCCLYFIDLHSCENVLFCYSTVYNMAVNGAQEPAASIVSFWDIEGFKRTLRRTEDGMSQCNELMKLMQERAEIEKEYAKRLHVWAKKWTEGIEKGICLEYLLGCCAVVCREISSHLKAGSKISFQISAQNLYQFVAWGHYSWWSHYNDDLADWSTDSLCYCFICQFIQWPLVWDNYQLQVYWSMRLTSAISISIDI